MIVVNGGLNQHRREIHDRCIAVLPSAVSPLRNQRLANGAACRCERGVSVARGTESTAGIEIQRGIGHVAILGDYVRHPVVLVTELEVVGSAPAALEERHVLIELVVLVGVKQGEVAIIRGNGGSTGTRLQSSRQWVSIVAQLSGPVSAPDGIHSARGVAEVVIVVEVVAETGCRDDFWSDCDITTKVKRGVRRHISDAVDRRRREYGRIEDIRLLRGDGVSAIGYRYIGQPGSKWQLPCRTLILSQPRSKNPNPRRQSGIQADVAKILLLI